MNNEIMQLTQVPIIKQSLMDIKEKVLERVNAVKNMAVTDETRKEAKEVRATLNKEHKEFDSRIKEIKDAIMAPYNELLETYKDCVDNPYKEADATLKAAITEIEDKLKAERRANVQSYFEEYAASLNIDFVKLDDVGLKITLNVSKKSLLTQVKEYLDKIAGDLESMMVMDNKADLLAEYKVNGYNLSQAITACTERENRKRTEEKRIAVAMAAQTVAAETVAKVAEVVAPPKMESPVVEKIENTAGFRAVIEIICPTRADFGPIMKDMNKHKECKRCTWRQLG